MENGEAKQTPKTVTQPKYWAITWAPDPARYSSYIAYDQWKTCLSYLLISRQCFNQFVWYPEITDSGNIHVHGIVEIKDQVKYFKKFIPTLKHNGFVKIKPVDDWAGWCAYIMKGEDNDLYEALFDCKLPYPYTNNTQYCHPFKPKVLFRKKMYAKVGNVLNYFNK